jgi:hypothetical protein
MIMFVSLYKYSSSRPRARIQIPPFSLVTIELSSKILDQVAESFILFYHQNIGKAFCKHCNNDHYAANDTITG